MIRFAYRPAPLAPARGEPYLALLAVLLLTGALVAATFHLATRPTYFALGGDRGHAPPQAQASAPFARFALDFAELAFTASEASRALRDAHVLRHARPEVLAAIHALEATRPSGSDLNLRKETLALQTAPHGVWAVLRGTFYSLGLRGERFVYGDVERYRLRLLVVESRGDADSSSARFEVVQLVLEALP